MSESDCDIEIDYGIYLPPEYHKKKYRGKNLLCTYGTLCYGINSPYTRINVRQCNSSSIMFIHSLNGGICWDCCINRKDCISCTRCKNNYIKKQLIYEKQKKQQQQNQPPHVPILPIINTNIHSNSESESTTNTNVPIEILHNDTFNDMNDHIVDVDADISNSNLSFYDELNEIDHDAELTEYLYHLFILNNTRNVGFLVPRQSTTQQSNDTLTSTLEFKTKQKCVQIKNIHDQILFIRPIVKINNNYQQQQQENKKRLHNTLMHTIQCINVVFKE
jgi:hypothetical protein